MYYYKIHFHDIEIRDIVNEYIVGLNWIVNYYHNRIIERTWYYRYNRSPMVSDIIRYFDTKYFDTKHFDTKHFDKSTNKVNYNVLLPLEHFIFVTPFNLDEINNYSSANSSLSMIQKYYKNDISQIIKFITNNQQYFYSLDKIYNNMDHIKYVDCSSSFFISKCHLLFMENYINITQYIKDIRKYLI